MKQYVDLQLQPSSNFTLNTLMNFVFGKVHLILVENKNDIGISFPKYWEKGLGEVLRLHSNENSLLRALVSPHIDKLRNYIKIGTITDVPPETQYRTFRRARSKSSLERCYRRSVRNGKITKEEAQARILQNKTSMLDLPYIKTQSLSTKQSFKLFVECGQITNKPSDGKFSCYGLSGIKTVPWF